MSPTLQVLWESVPSKRPSESLQQKLDRFLVYEDQISQCLGLRFTTELENAWDDLHAAELDRAYEAGFVTAFRLWAEVSATGQGVGRGFTPAGH